MAQSWTMPVQKLNVFHFNIPRDVVAMPVVKPASEIPKPLMTAAGAPLPAPCPGLRRRETGATVREDRPLTEHNAWQAPLGRIPIDADHINDNAFGATTGPDRPMARWRKRPIVPCSADGVGVPLRGGCKGTLTGHDSRSHSLRP